MIFAEDKPINAHSFLIVLRNDSNAEPTIRFDESFAPFCKHYHTKWMKIGIEVAFNTREHFNPFVKTEEHLSILIGDNSEWKETQSHESMAHASLITINRKSKSCDILTSIIGLPPIFIYKDREKSVITSDLYLLTTVVDLFLDLEPESILDLCRVGHTTRHKTLFKNTTLVSGGHKISWKQGHALCIKRCWEIPQPDDNLNYASFIEKQIDTFNCSVENMAVDNCFLSLTGGLDTRTILAALIKAKKEVRTSYTITGNPHTLDARAAKALSSNYGINHHAIILGDSFLNNLEKYAIEASRISGGIHSLEQAHEIFFYEQVDNMFTGRISGNIGNQIGRRGTEGVSMRNANIDILSSDFLSQIKESNFSGHWFDRMNTSTNGLNYISLLQDEIPNSSVGNFSIGNYFTVQKSPYAHRNLISLSQNIHRNDKRETMSPTEIRIKDLMHRFLGIDESISFQRKLINNCGGFVAHHPINWGWRAGGGISIQGTILGFSSLLDALVQKKAITNKVVIKSLSLLKISGLDVYRHPDKWMKAYLRDFVFDRVLSKSMDDVFNKTILEKLLNEYFDGKINRHYETICFALDISLAKDLFIDTRKIEPNYKNRYQRAIVSNIV